MLQKQILNTCLGFLFVVGFVSIGHTQWTQIGESINGTQPYERLGTNLSLSNDGMTLATTAPDNSVFQDSISQVKIFKLEEGNWVQAGDDLEGYVLNDGFTFPIHLSGDGLTLAKGSKYDTLNGPNSGSVRVYDISNGQWEQLGDVLLGYEAPYYFGSAISMSDDGRTIAISSNNSQAFSIVRVYELVDGSWVQKGQDLLGDLPLDAFGFSLDLNDEGDVIAIGAHFSNDYMEGAGEVLVFELVDDSWVQVGEDILGDNIYASLGFSVSLDANGETLLVGAPYSDVNGMNDAGYAIVYENIDGNWVQKGQKLDGLGDDWLGYDTNISSDGNVIAISAPTHRVVPFQGNTGKVMTFYYSNSEWVQRGDVLIGPYPGAWYGGAVGLSANGGILAVGAPRNSDNGYEAGQVQVYELMPLGINENDLSESVVIYPNPTRGLITIEFDNYPPLSTVSVVDLVGKVVRTEQINGMVSTINLSALENSIYIIEVRNTEGVKVERIILDR